MKKAVAMVMIVVMMLALGATAFAAGGALTKEQAKQAALDFAGVKAEDANFIQARKEWDDGRQVFEIKFIANGTGYEMHVDVRTGSITDFDMEYYGGFNQAPAATQPVPAPSTQPVPSTQPGGYNGYYYDDDFYYDYDFDDRFDRYDDMFDIFD